LVSAPQSRAKGDRMSNRVRIGVVALLSLLFVLLPLSVPEAAPPAGACIGTDACTGNTGGLQPGPCVGGSAWLDNSGHIHKNACGPRAGHGIEDGSSVCAFNQGAVGVSACRGESACFDNTGDVSKDSCVGGGACFENNGGVGLGACIDVNACASNAGN